MKPPKLGIRLLVTGAVIVVAVIAVGILYRRYVKRPWTRNGQVRADIVLVASNVGGRVVEVPVADNQTVRAGDLLFRIDPSAYDLAVRAARVSLEQTRQQVKTLEASVTVAEASVKESRAAVEGTKGRIEASKAGVTAAQGRVDGAKAGLDAARAKISQAKAALFGIVQQRDRADKLAKQGAGAVAVVDALNASVKAGQAGVEAAEAGLPQAQANLDQANAGVAQARATLTVEEQGLPQAEARLSRARADLDKARADLGEPGDANVRIHAAQASLATAELNLRWTRIVAPADGHVTNVTVYEGAFAAPGQPLLAFVDAASFRVLGYFRETQLDMIRPGAKAQVTLMSHPDDPIEAVVESIGWAINPPKIATLEGPSGLVPQVQPSFDWIRLAQRVPVRLKLGPVPEGIQLIAGTTASVSVDPADD